MKGPFKIMALLALCAFWMNSAAADDLTLRYEGSAQVEITSPNGRHVLIDVASPGDLQLSPGAGDILLTTHSHPDHWNRSFQKNFPGRQLFMNKGPLIYPDVQIFGLPSVHRPQDPMGKGSETNWIFLIATGGLRIAHFGDIGQKQLNDEQLKRLGRIDVAIMQFSNPRSEMTIENRMGFKLMQQLRPRLIIPTSHAGLRALETARTYWPCFAMDTEELVLSPAQFPQRTSLLVLGHLATLALDELGYKQWIK